MSSVSLESAWSTENLCSTHYFLSLNLT
jgi:hypothetical protein